MTAPGILEYAMVFRDADGRVPHYKDTLWLPHGTNEAKRRTAFRYDRNGRQDGRGCWCQGNGLPMTPELWIDAWVSLANYSIASAEIRNMTVIDWPKTERALVGILDLGPMRAADKRRNLTSRIAEHLFDPADALIDAYEGGAP